MSRFAAEDWESVARIFFTLQGEFDIGPEIPSAAARHDLGPYRFIRELGRGGQGTVYLAEDTRVGRLVAVKMLTSLDALSDTARQRFHREAVAASRLDHRGICALYESDTCEGVPYLAMQYVEGDTLGEVLRRHSEVDGLPAPVVLPGASTKRTALDTVVSYLEQAARAVHAAHQKGIIHRDLKPGNVMVTPDGLPVVLDFGLAKDLDLGGTITMTGDVFGTPPYMSPEQVRGETLGPRSDVWSLGVILYEGLTLRRPFDGPTPDRVFEAIRTRPPAPFGSRPRTVPEDLRVVVATALEKDAHRRYQTAGAFADDLSRFLERRPILARPVSRRVWFYRWVRRNPTTSAALLVVLGSLTVGLVLSQRALSSEREARKDERTARGETRQALAAGYMELASRLFRDAKSSSAVLAASLARRLHPSDAYGREFRRFWAGVRCAAVPRWTRALAPKALGSPDAEPLFGVDLVVDAAAETLFVLDQEGNVSVWHTERGQRLHSFRAANGRKATCLTGGSREADRVQLFVGTQEGGIEAWTVSNEESTLANAVETSSAAVMRMVEWPQGKRIFSVDGSGEVREWTLPLTADARPARTWSTMLQPPFSLAADPSDRFLALGAGGGNVLVIDLNSDPPTSWKSRAHRVNSRVVHVAWAKDKDRLRLMTAGGENEVRIWDHRAGAWHQLDALRRARPVGAMVALDGRLFAGDDRGPETAIGVWDTEKDRAAFGANVFGHTDEIIQMASSPDASLLFSASKDGTLRAWSLDQGPATFNYRAVHRERYVAVLGLPGDDVAFVAARPRIIEVWRLGASGWRLAGTAPLATPIRGSILFLQPCAADVAVVTGSGETCLFDPGTLRITGPLGLGGFHGSAPVAVVGDWKQPRLYWSDRDKGVAIFDLGREAAIASLWPSAVQALAVGPSDTLYTMSYGVSRRWAPGPSGWSETVVRNAGFTEPSSSLAVSTTRCIAVGTRFGKLFLLDAGGQVEEGPPMSGYVHSASFGHGDRLVWSAGRDRRLGLWPVARGEPPRLLITGHRGSVSGLTLLGGGNEAVTVSDDGEIRIHDLGLLFREPTDRDLARLESLCGYYLDDFSFVPIPGSIASHTNPSSRWAGSKKRKDR